MGIYYEPSEPAIVPDGFLSIGVPRIIDSDLRLSYVLWDNTPDRIRRLWPRSQEDSGSSGVI